jgi:alpha-glucan,water dikinase
MTSHTTERITTESGELLVEKRISDDSFELVIRMDSGRKCVLHWGVIPSAYASWQLPPKQIWPEGSAQFDAVAIQSPFFAANGGGQVVLKVDKTVEFPIIGFVLFFPDEGRWDNNRGRNYRIAMPGHERTAPPAVEQSSAAALAEMSEEIIEKEMGRNSWTLMHRFDLCYELLDKASQSFDGLALIFVWLRFSAIRQLDWQRNYNTKPRELAHAMDRLTLKLAGIYRDVPDRRSITRLILTTLGRGGNGQRVRDEILNIMHRRNIKEVSGHFLEEWHQKLHNNTTPDDVVICEAYIEFLRNNGNLDSFYGALEAGGVSKQRLESYERPIRSHPDFIPHLKDALLYDFGQFLGILKSVHSGTDLGAALSAARRLLDTELNGIMDFIWFHKEDAAMPVTMLAEKITLARKHLARRMEGQDADMRDLLFLDLSLEDFLRVAVERNLRTSTGGDDLVELIVTVLENIPLSAADEEFGICLRHWEKLVAMPRFGREWSLHAWAILDRLQRGLGAFIDRCHLLLQPKAEFLGRAFHADSWAVNLFSEEVMRGRPAFVLSLLHRYIDPVLRRSAELGDWQVISPGSASGRVEVISALKSIQGKDFDPPAIIVTEEVGGDEEIPEGVNAIITPVSMDLLAHLSVRARNSHILFATCYDAKTITRLKSLIGKAVTMSVNQAGEVIFGENHQEMAAVQHTVSLRGSLTRPVFSTYAVSINDFNERTVGGKSYHLKEMIGLLPSWIHLPASAALPFGVFEKVLGEDVNSAIASRYKELVRRIENTGGGERSAALAELRLTLLGLSAPGELRSSLRGTMKEAGLQWPENWEDAWTCVKRVWASKWNERAYLSRIARGIAHEDLFMAVLIQQVVEADYGYVMHTVNPFSGNREEVYAETVLGLGETLVGNYPGRALSFKCRKGEDRPELLSFPSKSTGLYGKGLIFRSDSNGEDIPGYAGAGIYDSFLLEKVRKVTLDYSAEPLVWDEAFRTDFLLSVTQIAAEIERVMGAPQDIEGARSGKDYFVVQSRPQVGIESD